ncbi:unnamed protein product [Kluyveromyces dobzhanskii CBS 2104]|uniref:Pre-mRNA-splicing factor CEF1 n=1 Tax=Kluyveromyces dobzhanskii CBS 2104 TaxID=1427455 RepID=A0A0A8L4C8_9SACH|nr:unnamed protein product [Kluyveromyces dobzhanskii CBS 2104]
MASVPIYVKGGIWTNLEDQILKAAVQKYGTHAWSKVASLLQKKNARQCQSRWNEFLNPSLNFEPFSKEEDDRLLDIAKRIPNQWRSIGEMMGRPAQTCIDRYNIILAADKDDLELAESTGVHIGEINPNNESLPAKADKDELLDEEREMLAEARARLLNTQGKKATRKIRERMLEESKRIAFLQKRRELKQAGVDSKIKAPKKKYASQIDYNEDVAYEQQPLPGIYDTSKEDEETVKMLKSFEKLVERKGLFDRKNEETKKKSQKRKQDDQSVPSLDRPESVLTDEYKKPRLELAAPTENQSKQLPSISILHLFAALPAPKNDFEIVLDEEDSHTELDTDFVNTGGISHDQQHRNESLKETAYVPTVFQINPELQAPPPIISPKDDVEFEMNRIIMAKNDGSTIHNPQQVNNYLKQIIDSASSIEVPAIPHPKVSENLNTPIVPSAHEISRMEHRISELQSTVENSVKVHRDAVSQLSQEFQEMLHPSVSKLAYQYHTDYMKYTHEYQTMHQESKRLGTDIDFARNTYS